MPVTGVAPAQQQFNRRTMEQLNALSRFQGLGVQGGTLPTEVPDVEQFITGKIRDEESSSSSAGNTSSTNVSSSFNYNPAGAGFTDKDGYLAYAFDQTYEADPWRGKVIVNGISTTLPTNTVDGANYAYPLNGETWANGSNVLLKRAGQHWMIIGSASAGGSLPMSIVIDCANGTITVTPGGGTSSSTTTKTATSSSDGSITRDVPTTSSSIGTGGTSSSVSTEGL